MTNSNLKTDTRTGLYLTAFPFPQLPLASPSFSQLSLAFPSFPQLSLAFPSFPHSPFPFPYLSLAFPSFPQLSLFSFSLLFFLFSFLFPLCSSHVSFWVVPSFLIFFLKWTVISFSSTFDSQINGAQPLPEENEEASVRENYTFY